MATTTAVATVRSKTCDNNTAMAKESTNHHLRECDGLPFALRVYFKSTSFLLRQP